MHHDADSPATLPDLDASPAPEAESVAPDPVADALDPEEHEAAEPGADEPAPADLDAEEAGSEESPARSFSFKRVFVLIAFAFLLLGVNAAFSTSAFYKLTPGPAPDITASIEGEVPNSEFGKHGHILFTTVEVSEIDWWEWASIKLSPEAGVSLVPASALGSSDSAQRAAAAAAQMRESKDTAYAVASAQVTGEPAAEGAGAKILSVVPGSVAEAAGLTPGDLVLAVGGRQVQSAEDLKDAIGNGDTHVLRVSRSGLEREVPVVLGSPSEKGRLGVELVTEVEDLERPLDVRTEGVGGPSAGLMFALTFTDALAQGDLTGGRNIAGTGTISPDGKVGPIGGVGDKVIGARDNEAEVFLSPRANYDEALAAAPEGIEVVPVDTYEDALEYLCSTGATSEACK